MAKKNNLPLIYCLGMALAVVGFCVPMFKASFGFLGSSYANGFNFINFDRSSFVTIGALFIFIGAVAGVVLSFLSVKNGDLLRLLAVVVSIVGGIILIIGFTQNKAYATIGKGFLKHAFVGFYLVVVGWVLALVGWVTKK